MASEDVSPDLSRMDEVEQHREVYARFGLAMYWAQVVEHGLVNALLYCQLSGQSPPQRDAEDPFEKPLSRTFGTVLKDFRAIANPPDDLAARLEQARVDRNTLAHSYFRLRETKKQSEVGRQEMVDELFEVTARSRALDEQLDDIVFWLGYPYGVTRERVEKLLEELSGT